MSGLEQYPLAELRSFSRLGLLANTPVLKLIPPAGEPAAPEEVFHAWGVAVWPFLPEGQSLAGWFDEILTVSCRQPGLPETLWRRLLLTPYIEDAGSPLLAVKPASEASRGQIFVFRPKGGLTPLSRITELSLNALAGQQEAVSRLREALSRFAAGGPPAHTLLYGPRGTGKSTAVHALFGEPQAAGIRLAELRFKDLEYLETLALDLATLPGRSAIFIDDVSFEIEGQGWQVMKAAMEGGLQRPFDRVWLLVTSNRKDLVHRPEGLEQTLQGKYTLQAIRALDDRFAVKAPFFKLNQDMLKTALETHLARLNRQEKAGDLMVAFQRFCMENNLDEPSGRAVRDFCEALGSLDSQA